MRKIIASLAAVASLAAADGGTAIANHGQPSRAAVCHEDQPCWNARTMGNHRGAIQEDSPHWNWATMGNRSRGIVTRNGTPLVVSPCRFKKLMNSGMIDYRTRDYMRGDRTAMATRCTGSGTRRNHPNPASL